MKSKIDDLRNTLREARLYHQGWWCLAGAHEDREMVLEGTQSHPGFFTAAASAFFVAFVSKLASVFDKRTDIISFKTIPQFNNHPAFGKIAEKGRKLYLYRCKFVAHRDHILTANPDTFKSGLSHDDLGLLLRECCKIFDDVANGNGLEPISDFSCKEDLMSLLAFLSAQHTDSP